MAAVFCAASALFALPATAQQAPYAGSCVSVPNGAGTGAGNSSVGGYGDNQAAPITLFQFAPAGTSSATYINSLVLPQSASGANLPVSGEYGSSSEGTIQLSGNGQYLTLMGYGIDAPASTPIPAPTARLPHLPSPSPAR
jgi:hypothetical protein